MAQDFQFEMVFTADTSAVRPATQAVKTDLAGVGTVADQAARQLDQHAAALERDAAAAKKAAEASTEQAKAARDAYVQSTTGTRPLLPQSPANPLRTPSAPVPTSEPSSGGSTPEDLDKLKVAYLPLYAAQRDYEKALADIDVLQKSNAISSDEHAVALARAQKSFDNEAAAAKRSATALLGHKDAIKLTSFETKNLAFQANDTVQSLALGMPPLQVLLQQGPQAVQAVGGVGNALRLVGQVATVSNVALAGTAAAVIAGAAAWNDYLNSIKPVEIAASGLGRAVAGTAEDMEKSARAGANTANISVKSARSMEAQFLSTGRIGSENFEKLIGVSKNFATTLGINSDEVGSTLAQMFADPAKAAQTLYHQYGLIDGATADYATRLANQNRLSEAQSVILDGLPDRLAKATEATTLMGRAWKDAATFASNFYDWAGKGIDHQINGPSLAEQVEAARKKLDEAKATRDATAGSLATRLFGNMGQGDVDRAQADYDQKRKQLDEQEKKQAQDRAEAERRQAGANAVAIAQQSPANADLVQRQQLQDSITALEAGKAAAAKNGDLSDSQRSQIDNALEARKTLLDALTNKQATLNQIDALDVKIQNERNPAIRANLIAQQTRLQLSLQETNANDAAAKAESVRNKAMMETIASGAAQAGDMQAEIQIRQQLNAQVASGAMTSSDAAEKLQEELQLRPLILAAATAEADKRAELNKVIADLRAGYAGLAAAQKEASANEFIQGQRDQLQTLQAQLALVGQSQATQDVVLAQLKTEQEIRQRGLDTNSQQAQQMRQYATAVAEVNTQLQRTKDAWSTFQRSGEDAIDAVFNGIANGDKFGDIAKSVGKDLVKGLQDLSVRNPIKTTLFNEAAA